MVNFKRFNPDIVFHASCGSKTTGMFLLSAPSLVNAKTIIEIGIANAFTAQCLALGLEINNPDGGSLLISCDINIGCCQVGKDYVKLIAPTIEHDVVCGDSRNIVWGQHLQERSLDIAYVDGDHADEPAMIDVLEMGRLLRVDGLLIVHDHAPGQPGVMHAVDSMIEKTDPKVWTRLNIPERGDTGDIASVILQRIK